MTGSAPVRAMIEIEHSWDTIKGKLALEGAPATKFYGWLELIDQLERATSTHTPAKDQQR